MRENITMYAMGFVQFREHLIDRRAKFSPERFIPSSRARMLHRHRSRIHYHRRQELSSRENSAIPRCRACPNLHDLRLSREYMRIVQIQTAVATKRNSFRKMMEGARRYLYRCEKFRAKNRINRWVKAVAVFWYRNILILLYRKDANSLIKDRIIVNNFVRDTLNVLSFITSSVPFLH